jgi:hypothetical protein
MSRERNKRRIPTSAELEERGEVSPPDAPGVAGRPGILKRLFRAGRFRVAEDVAARKHVAAPLRSDFTGVGDRSPDVAASAQAERRRSSGGDFTSKRKEGEGAPSRRRTIRIDDSLKERRGLGHSATEQSDDA